MLLMIVLLVYCLKSVLSGALVMKNVRFWQWSGIVTCLPIFATSFCSHPLVLPMYFNLRQQSVERMNVACKQATITISIFYTIVGLCGYLPLTEAVPGDILATLPRSIVTDGIHAMFFISLTASFPLIILPCRQAINTLFFEQQKEDGTFSVSGDMPFHRHVTTTVLVVYSTMIMGVLVPDVQTVLGIMGTTTGSAICFIYPSAIHAKLRKVTFTGRIVLGVGIFLLLIRASSVSYLKEGEFQLQPVRKSIVVDELGNTEPIGRNKGSRLPELMDNGGDSRLKLNSRGLIYRPRDEEDTDTVVNKETASTKEVIQPLEAGLPSAPGREEILKELKEMKRTKTFTPLSELRPRAKAPSPAIGRGT
ncbi:putative sodium-coupled neutral amino acid transporter 10 [Heptranchias perlo]|uniref:putative sodium-coupled neutral amino acid transporter 10 n=1 Tax=Heptranchias perlo TaxID=212740 RepID=UPI003559F2F4